MRPALRRLAIAASSLPFLAGCGASSHLTPIGQFVTPQGPSVMAVSHAPAPVAPRTSLPSATVSRSYLTQSGASRGVFSPRGDRLAFEISGKGVYVSRADGYQPESLGDGQDPAWSPDGGAIAVVRGGGQGSQLVEVNATNGQSQVLFSTPDTLKQPAWLPNGRGLVFVAGDGLYRLDLPGNRPVRLCQASGAESPSVSPKGDVVLFAEQASGGSTLAWVPIAGGAVTTLHAIGTNPVDPAFSPTGNSIAYVAADGLYVANATGTQAQRLTSDATLAAPHWNPAQPQLVVTAPHGASTDLTLLALPAR